MAYPKMIAERLARRVDRSAGPDACWPWLGMRIRGYGFIVATHHGKRVPAHRLAFEIAVGAPIPTGMSICHRCDNPPCCNPAHLFLGTQSDNARDMWGKRRGYVGGPGARAARGERVGGAKLTEALVLDLRAARASGQALKALSVRFGVSQATVSMVASRKVWRHV